MGKREVTPLHRGGRVGDDGGEVVGVKTGGSRVGGPELCVKDRW